MDIYWTVPRRFVFGVAKFSVLFRVRWVWAKRKDNTLLRNQNIDIDIMFVAAGIQANLG